MIRTSRVGRHSLRLYARTAGEATTLARYLNNAEQTRTIGPKAEKGGSASLLVVYGTASARDAAQELAKAAPIFTPVADLPTTVPTQDEGTTEVHDMATKSTKGKRPTRGEASAELTRADADLPKKAAAPKKKARTKKAAAPKRKASKKKAAAPKKKASKKKAAALNKAPKRARGTAGVGADGKPKLGRPVANGVGALVKQLLRAGKSRDAIVSEVTKAFPNSAMVARPDAQLAWYRHRVKAEDAEKAGK